VNRVVTDASVAPKWFITEVHSQEARTLAFGPYELLVPELFPSEFANYLVKAVRRTEFQPFEAHQVFQITMDRVVVSAAVPLGPRALELALTLGLSAYDATYVALAEASDCPLVTADRRLYDAIRPALAKTVHWIADPLV